jgi:peptide/nickel transport system permease protein
VARYVLRRLGAALPLLLLTSFVVFSFIHVAPGSPERILLGGKRVDAQTLEAVRSRYHLDDPFLAQYWHWLSNAVTGDLGESIAFRAPVWSVVSGRVAPTLQLAAYATVLIFVLGLLLGTVAALRRDRLADTVISVSALVLSSVSAYVAGILLIVFFAVDLGWFPVFGLGSGLLERIHHLTLPAVALALGLTALVARVTRTSMSRALDQEFVETARSRGLPKSTVVFKHALRSAFIPVLTISGLIAGYLISGAVLVEFTFGLGGLGSLLVEAVQAKDFAVVQAVVLIFTAAFVLINLLVDLLYAVVDPRVRLQQRAEP